MVYIEVSIGWIAQNRDKKTPQCPYHWGE